uniref:Pectinesterase inhibitor domain-containing protein n=1 Tax=Oryza barthii TaxID=65489 RepID=A0A0D3F621_9ORYZ
MAPRASRRPAAAAAAVVVAVVLAVSGGVGATPETACRAAAEEDRRVDYEFCVSRLSHHHDSPDADTWGLAKVAADVGVCIAGDAAYDAKAKLQAAKAGAFADAGVAPSPLERQTAESVKIAIVCTAITNLPCYTAALLAVAVLGVAFVDATVVTTCRAAADADARVDYGFCVAELGKHHDSPGADAWGLAKVAALARCGELYRAAGFAFAEAHDDINARDYAAGKGKAADAASLARQCDAAFAAGKDDAAAAPPVIAQHGSYAARIAIVCTAITNLIE